MEKLIINSYEEFASHLGEQLGVSDWLEVTQDRINLFADATLDRKSIQKHYCTRISYPFASSSLVGTNYRSK